MRLDRLFAITVMLLNRERVSARELADYFEVSIRTIYRDVEAINMAGIPLVSYPGHQGGFAILDSYKLDHQFLSRKDMVTLLGTLRGVNDAFQSREMDLLIEKLTSILPHAQAGELNSALDEIIFDVVPWGLPQNKLNGLQIVRQAVHEKRLLQFTYRNLNLELCRRTIEPISLVNKGAAWYVFAYCRLKEDFRIFRISRMEDVSLLPESFNERGVTYRAYLAQQPAREVQGFVDVTLHFDALVKNQGMENFDPQSITEDEQGGAMVCLHVDKSEWLYAIILSYGEHVEVVSPQWLREKIRQKIIAMQQLYNPDIGLSQASDKIE